MSGMQATPSQLLPGPTSGHSMTVVSSPHRLLDFTAVPVPATRSPQTIPQRRKAPPVDEFTGKDPDFTFDDCLPSLERAILWNSWTEEEQLIQLADHLKSCALQESNLLESRESASYSQGVKALRSCLDCESKALAAQDFRHSTQCEAETVADFIRRLEHTFRVAYGQDCMPSKTKDMLLLGQIQEGQHLRLMKAPAVSRARNY